MTFPRYPEYKDSGVEWLGEVPAHWRVLAGRRLFKQRKERPHPGDEQLTASQAYGVVPQRQFMEDTERRVAIAIRESNAFRHVERDDFVISLRSFEGGIERSYYKGIVSSAYTVLQAASSPIEPKYFRYLLKDVAYISALQATTDSLRDGKSIRFSDFGSIALPLAPREEQEKIAVFLNHETGQIDALIEEQRRLIELLKEKRQAVISHAVTKGLDPNVPMKDPGVEWLGEVPAHWDAVSLRRVLDAIEQGWSPECNNTPAEDGGWGVLKAGAVNNGIFRENENKSLPDELHPRPELEVRSGDVLLCRASGSTDLIGSVAHVDQSRGQLMLSDKLFRLIFTRNVSPKFISRTLGSVSLRRQIEQSINGAEGLANNLSQATIKALMIPVPPLPEQNEIVDHIEHMTGDLERLLDASHQAVAVLQERRSALISAAVTGKIDVRGWSTGVESEEPELAMVAEHRAGYSAQGGAA
ncbi:restriction endonuclease subunit S [Thioalkalivibrio sp. ALMg11]|uniref:restriction endonuclease subunit S n=1 Tax=Thioalkalivibrio sp. ALMg11 TaxID=1158165 RepID=UPI0003780B40|nr:restriction endonuclease subunit S [Thioalkalivibrio sp. ALMg11]